MAGIGPQAFRSEGPPGWLIDIGPADNRTTYDGHVTKRLVNPSILMLRAYFLIGLT